LTKEIDAPMRYVYDWCTDYSESDPQLTGSTRKRVIIDKTKKQAVYVSLSDDPAGKAPVSVYFVKLRPHNSWHLDMYNADRNETAEYNLKSISKDQTLLKIVFKNTWKHPERAETDQVQEVRLNQIWDKYIKALEQEYSQA
jgi:hypothetical protein